MPAPLPRTVVPRRRAGADPAQARLTPLEGFVLSQIDGGTSLGDLEVICGQSAERLAGIVVRLVEAGLVDDPAPGSVGAGGGDPASGATAERPVAGPRGRAPGAREPPRAAVPPPPPPAAAAESPAAEPDALEPEERRAIDTALIRATTADFYALLGVKRSADRAAIRTAYFGLAKRFHPDAFYGRVLGGYEAKLERIFRQFSRAYEVLSRTKTRREYDEYLRGQAILAGQDEEIQAYEEEERRRSSVPPPPPDERPVLSGGTPIRGMRVPDLPSDPEAATMAEAEPVDIPEGSPAEAPVEESREPIREAASGPAVPGPVGEASRPAEAPAGEPGPAGPRRPSPADAWRRQRVARDLAAALRSGGASSRPREHRGSSYLATAQEALSAGEWGRVAGLLDAAERLGLEGSERESAAKMRERAAGELATICARQAKFAESTGDLATAYRHAEMAARYRPEDPAHWGLVARLGLRLGRELHRARDAALEALRRAPGSVEDRLTLVRIYLAAGLGRSARHEVEIVLKADPKNGEAKALFEEARRAKD